MSDQDRAGTAVTLAGWYVVWALVGVVTTVAGPFAPMLFIGVGVVLWFAVDLFLDSRRSGPHHLIGAIVVGSLAHAIALGTRLAGVWGPG